MNEFVVAGLIIAAIVGGVWLENRVRRPKNPLPPESTPDAERFVNGIAVGYKTYADIENELCVHVLNVKDGLVEFTLSNASDAEFLPEQRFLETYFRTPNGCEYPVKESGE